jgi:hypothetical protein
MAYLSFPGAGWSSLAVRLAFCIFLLSNAGGAAAAADRHTHLQASSKGSHSKEIMIRRNLLANRLGKTPPMG